MKICPCDATLSKLTSFFIICSVCRKVTHDKSVDAETRSLRKKALLASGDVFKAFGNSTDKGDEKVKS